MREFFKLEYTRWPHGTLSSEHACLNDALQEAADMVWEERGVPTNLIVGITGESTANRETLKGIADIRNIQRRRDAAAEAMEQIAGFGSF